VKRYSPAGRSLENKQLLLSLSQLRRLMRIIDKIQVRLGIKTSFADTFPFCVVNKKYHKYIEACFAGTAFGALDFEGNLKLCLHSPRPLGNILKTPINKLWNNSLIKKYRNLKWLSEECKKCKYLELCNCGCHLSNLVFDGKDFSMDYYFMVKKYETKNKK
jgi:radical SAM protein with 4Fe4S-binding SPASM domain